MFHLIVTDTVGEGDRQGPTVPVLGVPLLVLVADVGQIIRPGDWQILKYPIEKRLEKTNLGDVQEDGPRVVVCLQFLRVLPHYARHLSVSLSILLEWRSRGGDYSRSEHRLSSLSPEYVLLFKRESRLLPSRTSVYGLPSTQRNYCPAEQIIIRSSPSCRLLVVNEELIKVSIQSDRAALAVVA